MAQDGRKTIPIVFVPRLIEEQRVIRLGSAKCSRKLDCGLNGTVRPAAYTGWT